MTETPRRRRRWPWILLAVVVAVPVIGIGAALVFLDAERLRPRLVAAVEQATGRDFHLGRMRLALSLVPTLELSDVALANAPGGSRPQMLTARRVEVRAALLPLLSSRIEIARIVIEDPDLLLEVDAEGRGNWQFTAGPPAVQPEGQPGDTPAGQSPSQPATPPAAQPAGPARDRMAFAIDSFRLEGGRLTWRDAASGREETVGIAALEAAAPQSGPVRLNGELAIRGQAVTLGFQGGTLAAFGGEAPWPVDATLATAGAEARVQGSLAAGQAWSARAELRAADLARLAPLLPDVPLPPLRDVVATGAATGTGGALATVGELRLVIGASDLALLRPGLRLQRATLSAAGPDAPMALEAEATSGGVPIRVAGSTGSPALLAGQATGPLPVDLRLESQGAVATLAGRIAEPRALSGVDLTLAVQAADLATLSPLAGMALPALREFRLGTRIAERTPGFAGGAHLRDLVVTSSAGEVRGQVTLVVGERPGITGRLSSQRLDLDAMRGAVPAAAPAPAAAAGPAPAPAPQPAPTTPAHADGRVIPDLPLPMAALRSLDADLRLDIAQMALARQPWRQVVAHLKLDAGQARLSPFSAETPAGPLALELGADVRGTTPRLDLVARSPGIDIAALQRLLGQPVRVSGSAELDTAMRGSGAGLRAVAASLSGHLGIAMLDATVEPALMQPVQATLRERVPLLPPLPQRLPVECVAIRAEATDGQLRIGTLLVDSPAAKVAGSGEINLGDETLSLRMLHDVRAAGSSLRVSADLGGTLASPAYRGVRAENLGDLVGSLAGRVGGDLGAVLGALAPPPGARPAPLPDCGPALAAARGGRQGAVPPARAAEPAAPAPEAPAQPAAPAQRRGVPQPADLLRELLRR